MLQNPVAAVVCVSGVVITGSHVCAQQGVQRFRQLNPFLAVRKVTAIDQQIGVGGHGILPCDQLRRIAIDAALA